MKKNEIKLLTSRAVNKIGNVVYDYGNSSWIVSLGAMGQHYLGYYQLAENLISLLLNPIGGAVADRFKRRKILLLTDFIGGFMCLLLALIGTDQMMLYGLITVNAVLAISHAFSGTSFRSYVVTLVDKESLVDFNAKLEIISRVISISSPLLAFLFVDRFGLKPTLLLDSLTFFLSFILLFSIRQEEQHVSVQKEPASISTIFRDIKVGLDFILHEKEVFFLLAIAALVNFFIAAFNYLLPFSNQLFADKSSYAMLLSMGATGSILGAVFAKHLFKHSHFSILLSLALSGVGLTLITPLSFFGLPVILITSGNLIFEFFLTIFNIHFFSMVQKKVPNELLGRVFSSIFTVAVLFMPLATTLMTTLSFSIHILTFAVIGLGILTMSGMAYLYAKFKLH
ncbi:MFS transporter [Streptococcus minor]|uniref:MFS transporter n=1 Tax=Streptococcus minor TaxID=229549 RepID=A0A3P1VG95_9STRE|nr:MFS transporter [Streptococcus minor]RRD32666.1 MFS transporter [Streptococcus minor]